MVPTSELKRRFEAHPSHTDKADDLRSDIRKHCLDLAIKLNAIMPDSRESAQALSALELVLYHADAAVARNQ